MLSDRTEARLASNLDKTMVQITDHPTVGLFYVQENVHELVPALVKAEQQLLASAKKSQSLTLDAREAHGSLVRAVDISNFAPIIRKLRHDIPLLQKK